MHLEKKILSLNKQAFYYIYMIYTIQMLKYFLVVIIISFSACSTTVEDSAGQVFNNLGSVITGSNIWTTEPVKGQQSNTTKKKSSVKSNVPKSAKVSSSADSDSKAEPAVTPSFSNTLEDRMY